MPNTDQRGGGGQSTNLSETRVVGEQSRDGDWTDWISTSVSAILVIACLLWYLNNEESTLLLSGLFGAVIGWACGFISTPYNTTESKQIGDITKVVSGIAGGYVVAKLDRLFELAVPDPGKQSVNAFGAFPSSFAAHTAICIIMFITIFILTYVSRAYSFEGFMPKTWLGCRSEEKSKTNR